MRPWPKSPLHLVQVGALLMLGAVIFWMGGAKATNVLIAGALGLACFAAGLVASRTSND